MLKLIHSHVIEISEVEQNRQPLDCSVYPVALYFCNFNQWNTKRMQLDVYYNFYFNLLIFFNLVTVLSFIHLRYRYF